MNGYRIDLSSSGGTGWVSGSGNSVSLFQGRLSCSGSLPYRCRHSEPRSPASEGWVGFGMIAWWRRRRCGEGYVPLVEG